ncbi:hypothetical protein [Xanthomonas citri]|uniref:hypothetical protein n=1 Tax=Xanthomonas citri TaxID=346 RepID=UPI0002D29146|nr:hypothetical protein [Xanthomonas citri]AMU97897.1 hypothetical protein TP37_07110 [Xanthomonas citri pv. aurantifolii]AMV02655.1 hypothetical protein TP50_09520 [Xanthomonas citri pv. aurantifolii]MCC8490008.1 hypothetical protein [Xanthomonas citri pv. fuscans]TBW94702.1 hypothetical protein TP49_18210 [Xanthomonas citri pv. aurantifolii]TBW96804.1 hypothetical protein TP47_13295 [Xanthomonas citri pv. aurantifolii]
MIVTTQHLFTIPGYSRRAGFCRSGARAFFQRHGLDWRGFVHNGIEAEQLEATGDALALALVKWARESEQQKGQRDGR